MLPMIGSRLEAFVRDRGRPLVLRQWAVCWLGCLPGAEALGQVGELLADEALPTEVRKAAAGTLATQRSEGGLALVDKAMWSRTSPAELQLHCYWALTWSEDKSAAALIRKAADHPNKEIRMSIRQQSEP